MSDSLYPPLASLEQMVKDFLSLNIINMNELKQQLKQKQEELKEAKQRKIIHAVSTNMSKQEMDQILHINGQQKTQYKKIVRLCIQLQSGGQSAKFWKAKQGQINQRLFDEQQTIDFNAHDGLHQCKHPSLIIVQGNRKSRKQQIVQEYANQIQEQMKSENILEREILISIYGVVDDKIIDLLSINQDFTKLTDKKLKILHDQQNNVTLRNVLQIAISNEQEYDAIFNLYKSIKAILEQSTNKKIDIVVFQFINVRMNEQHNKLEQIINKSSIIKITNSMYVKQQLFHLKQCLIALERNKLIPSNNSILTKSLEDNLRENIDIIYVGALSSKQKLYDQLNILQFMDNFQVPCTIRTNVNQQKQQQQQQYTMNK